MSMTREGMRATLPAPAMINVPVPVLERLVATLERLTSRLDDPSAPAASPDGLLTKAQVAARLGGKSSIRKVERLMKAGRLRKVAGLGARTTRFRPADVDRLLADDEARLGRRRL